MKILKIASLLTICSALLAHAEEQTPILAVVVSAQQNSDNLKLSPNSLKLIYLRKQLYWPNGKRIFPVNLYTEHSIRSQFSQSVLGSLPKQQIDYWNGLYFNGIQPPHSVNSEEAVLRYIAQTPYAIGYVDACLVDSRVRPILWIDNDQIAANSPENLQCQ